MERKQMDAIVRAVLEPDTRVQDEIRRKREAEALRLARQRKVALLMLAGALAGGVVAHLVGARFSQGILWGGIAGSVLGWTGVWFWKR
ncbi:hypothetical protein [Coralloluteibacterium thermophilus]|uniref:Uncharacterized protein n=1 Tax=Coralloluteibacterium thermophilum TaxID=2707049 RepID=A0ABV9NLB4_9GAMM